MKNEKIQNSIAELEQKNADLTTFNRKVTDSLQKAGRVSDFTTESSLYKVLETTMKRSTQLVSFREGGIFLVDEITADFSLQFIWPDEAAAALAEEMEHLIRLKLFNWAIKRKKPVFFKSLRGDRQLLLHVLATSTRVRGMFCCYLDEEYRNIADHQLTLFSLIMYHSANAIQSHQLLKWNNEVNKKLKEDVRSQEQSRKEIQAHRDRLKWLVSAQKGELSTVNDKLEQEINERRRAEMALTELERGIEKNVLQRTQELEQVQLRLAIDEKRMSVGQLASGIAHELYNPLNFIRTNMVCLEEYFADFSGLLGAYEGLAESCRGQALMPELTGAIEAQKQLIKYEYITEEIVKIFKENASGFQRINEVVNILRNFSNEGFDSQIDSFDLNQEIGDTIELFQNINGRGLSIETEFADLPSLTGIRHLIRQALFKVLVNSVQASESHLARAEARITVRTFVKAKQIGCIIGDNGPGIPEQEQPRIFDPFFTTREPGDGMGLGLSTAYDIIVHKHGGEMFCECPPEGGTVVTMLLPLIHQVKEIQS